MSQTIRQENILYLSLSWAPANQKTKQIKNASFLQTETIKKMDKESTPSMCELARANCQFCWLVFCNSNWSFCNSVLLSSMILLPKRTTDQTISIDSWSKNFDGLFFSQEVICVLQFTYLFSAGRFNKAVFSWNSYWSCKEKSIFKHLF